jgi:hypothetical protein
MKNLPEAICSNNVPVLAPNGTLTTSAFIVGYERCRNKATIKTVCEQCFKRLEAIKT